MKTLFVTALYSINVNGSFGRGIRLEDDLFLTNDRGQIEPLLTSDLKLRIGSLETNSLLRDTGTTIYGISNHPQTILTKDEALPLLNERLDHVQTFLMALWLVKDNAVNNELGFFEYPYKPSRPSKVGVTSNFLAVRFSKADGSVDATDFTESERREARDLYSTFSANLVHHDGYRGFVLPEEYQRLSRIFYFVQSARQTLNLGNKISRYITCFETVFCTEAVEMAHKLAERVAFFLANTPTERPTTFRNIKTAYNIRSKTTHGDKISKKLGEQAQSIAVGCDKLLRDAWIKIVTTP
jgi:hypothetical protein